MVKILDIFFILQYVFGEIKCIFTHFWRGARHGYALHGLHPGRHDGADGHAGPMGAMGPVETPVETPPRPRRHREMTWWPKPRHRDLVTLGSSELPSGKHTKNYGKSPFLMGISTINGHFQ